MTIELNDLLVVLLYLSLIVFVIVLIILGIKLIKTLKKLDVVIDDVNNKMDKLDGAFEIIDMTSDFTNKILGIFASILDVFKKDKKGTDIDE